MPIVQMAMGSANGRGLFKVSQESVGKQGLSAGLLKPSLAHPKGREPRSFQGLHFFPNHTPGGEDTEGPLDPKYPAAGWQFL